MQDNNNQQNPQDITPEKPLDPQVFEQQVTHQTNLGYEQPDNSTQPQDQEPTYPQPEYSSSYGVNPPQKKKLHTKLIVSIIVFLVFISGVGVAYAFKDTLINSYHLMTKSPIEYYTYLEKSSLDEIVAAIPTDTDKSMENFAYDISSDITFNRKALDSILQSYIGTDLTYIEDLIGIPIESIGFDFLVGSSNNLISETIGVEFNQKDLITAELLLDALNHQIFMRIPELSDAYLSQSLIEEGMGAETYQQQLDLLTSDTFTKLLKKYGYLIIDNINQATLEKNVSLSLDTLSAKCNKLTVTITDEDAKNIVLAILETAKTDENILVLLPMMGLTQEQYLQAIEDTKVEINSSESDSEDINTYMQVYIDHKGNILGREFTSGDSTAFANYTLLSKGDYSEYNFNLKDDLGNQLINITGKQTTEKGSKDGDLTVFINTSDSQIMSDISIDVTYEDVRSEYKDGQYFQYGTYTISSLDLMGLQIISEDSVADGIQYNKTTLQLGASSLFTIDTFRKQLEEYEVTLPAEDAVIYDTTQSEDYLASIDMEGYLNYLSEIFDFDSQLLYDLFQ